MSEIMDEIQHLKNRLSDVTRDRDEFLQQRNNARQLACDLWEALKPFKSQLSPAHLDLLTKIDRARGIGGGYEWPDPYKRAQQVQDCIGRSGPYMNEID